MTPRQFITGLTATILLSIAFYTWLLYGVLGVPFRWVLIVMGGTGAALTLSGIYGYRLWLPRNYPRGPSTRSVGTVSIMSLLLLLWAIAAPAWAAAYLLSRGVHLAGLLVSLAAGGLALYTIFWSPTLRDFRTPGPTISEPFVPGLVQGFRAFMIVGNVVFVAGVGVALIMGGEHGIGAFLLILVASGTPWVVRWVKKELSR